MTATLETITPQSTSPSAKSFTTRFAPWTKLGVQIDTEVDSAEAARLGGLDFEVEFRAASFASVSEKGNKTSVTVPNRKAIVRTDTGEFFDFVSTDYEVVQYRDAFAFMDKINPRYTAAGTMSHGKQGFLVTQLPDFAALNVEIAGQVDPHDLYVIVRTSHDRSKALEISVMPLRERCMNQLALSSFSVGAPQRWSIKHVGDVESKLKIAEQVLTVVPKYAEIFANKARQLGSVDVTDEDARAILKRVLPDKKRRDETVEAIMSTYHNDESVGFVGTGWGLTNAVSTYYDWGRSDSTRTDQSRFTSGLLGDTAKYFNRTAQLVLAR